MDIAIAIEQLVPLAQYGGSTTANTEECYDALRWEDERTKPTWAELTAAWDSYVAQNGTPQQQRKIHELWTEADQAALQAADHNARAKYLKMYDGASQAKKDMIDAVDSYMDSIWTAYYTAKAQVQAGDLTATLPDFSGAPYSFYDIVVS